MPMTIQEAITAFIQDASNRCSPATVQFYKKRLKVLAKNLQMSSLSELTSDTIKTAIKNATTWPDGSSKAPDTVRATWVAWEQLQKWMIDEKIIPTAITEKIRKPGGRKREALPTLDEIKLIIEHSKSDFVSIFRSLRLTGARPGELSAATIGDIDPAAGEIILVQHKTARRTGKPRRIAIGHPSLIEIVAEATAGRTDGPIFLRSSGSQWTSSSLSHAFRKARDAAGVRKEVVLYLMRHQHGNELYKATNDLKAVADALGHAQLSTTMRYTRVNSEQLKKSQRLFDEGL